MDIHFAFTFGIGKYFNFSFRFGSPVNNFDGMAVAQASPNPGYVKTGLSTKFKDHDREIWPHFPLKAETNSELPTGPHRLIVQSLKRQNTLPSPFENNSSLASVDTGGGNLSKEAVRLVPNATQLLKCPLFTLPLEIRRLIYGHILVSEHPIVNPGKLLEGGKIELLASCGSIHVIDAAIVRTCRGIYAETMPMLYEDNAFEFHKASDISHFHAGGLQRFPRVFTFKNEPHGRLAFIRNLILKFSEPVDSSYGRVLANQARVRHQRDIEQIEWGSIFHPTGYPDDGFNFPALEKLTLDLRGWHFNADEGILVKPFIKKFCKAKKLRELLIKGVRHAPTLKKFEKGILEDGGLFRVEN